MGLAKHDKRKRSDLTIEIEMMYVRSPKGIESLQQTFLIPISVQPNSVGHLCFKLKFFDPTEFIV